MVQITAEEVDFDDRRRPGRGAEVNGRAPAALHRTLPPHLAESRQPMETKPFGWTGVQVPAIGQGTWHMGESKRDREREIEALTVGLDCGLTHIDTAEMYGDGAAEEIVGSSIRGRRREDLFLVSKVLPRNASYRGTIRAAERTLRRLGTDYLDLYLLHWRGRYPVAETMRAMEDLVAAGKIRFLGVSNFDVTEMREALSTLSRTRLACNQILYNLAQRGVELDLIPFCRERDIAVAAYSPFARFPRGGGLEVLEKIGARHGKTLRQVVLRFLTRAPGVFAVSKAADPGHVRENAEACGFTLTRDDLVAIDRAFPAPSHPVPLAMR